VSPVETGVDVMNRSFPRGSVALVAALSAAVCTSSPTASQPGPMPSPSANVHATGEVTFPSCSDDGKCSFEGQVTNDGPDCASNVRGVTHLLDASGKEIEAQPWEILGRVRRGATSFSGCCFSRKSVDTYRSQRTDVSFEPLRCV
jgi:hypothetical protein